jgi:uncharacterized protein (TIGR00297 family)
MAIPAALTTPLEVAAVGVLAAASLRKGVLTSGGALAAFAIGSAIVLQTNVLWLLLLLILLGLAASLTSFRFEEKRERSVAEKRGGRRGARNVLANGLPPTLAAAAAPTLGTFLGSPAPAALAFASGVAVSAADTAASEVGSLADQVILVTTLKPVPPGTDGGVSREGQAAALGAALVTGIGGILLLGVAPALIPGAEAALPPTATAVLVVTAAGFAGCQVDSLLGATLEVGRLVTKQEVNLVAIAFGTVAGLVAGATLY